MRGQVAHVPHTIVTPYPSVDDDIFNNPVYGSRGSRENYYSTVGFNFFNKNLLYSLLRYLNL